MEQVLTVFFISGWPIYINYLAVKNAAFLHVKRRPKVDGYIKRMYTEEQSCHEAFSHIHEHFNIFYIIFSYGY